MDDLQVGNHVLDLGPLVERETAYDVILQLVTAHALFEQARLGIGAIEHRRPRVLALLRCFTQVFGYIIRDEKSFVLAVGRFVISNFCAALPRSPQVLAFALDVVRHHG